MKMRVLFELAPPPGRPILTGHPDWIMVVRHTWWIFAWDVTYSRVKIQGNAFQWMDEDRAPVKQRIFNFLESELNTRCKQVQP